MAKTYNAAPLLDAGGDDIAVVDANEDALLKGALAIGSTGIPKASVTAFTIRVTREEDGTELRNESVLDVNGGTLNTDGSFEVYLDDTDNVVDTALTGPGEREYHVIEIGWTWLDAEAEERVGKSFYRYPVRRPKN